jgi:3-oxoacyl-[acyl-carrier-protein] synthase II
MIVAAARMAEADSGIEIEPETDRVGVSVATGIGGLKSFQDCYDQLLERGPDRVNPFSIPAIIPNMGAAWVSMELGTRGPLWSECTACAASNMAIGQALDDIRLGRADVMLAGGTEAGITKVGIGGFGAMRALSSTRGRATPRSTPSSAVTASPPTPSTSPSPTRPACTLRARCEWLWTMPGSAPRTSTTSTRTAPRRRSATRARRA